MPGRILIGLIALAVVLHGGAFAQKSPAEMPRSVSSADGFVSVYAVDMPGETTSYRIPIMRFASSLLRDVERVYALKMPRREQPGIVIHAQEGRTNDVRVIAKTATRADGVYTRIWLPSPGSCSLDALRFELVKGYLQAWVDRNQEGGSSAPSDLPDWLVMGFLRTLSADTMHNDIRYVLNQWLDGKLPRFSDCVAKLKLETLRDAIMAGYLVGWMKERHVVEQVLNEFAGGKTPAPQVLLKQLTGTVDATGVDSAADERLNRLARAVLSPGRASAWDVRFFATRLTLNPSKYSDDTDAPSTCSFRESIERADEKGVRLAAANLSREMPMYAIGRGDDFAAMADLYRRFLLALARGADKDELKDLLLAAESKLSQMKAERAPNRPVQNENGKDNNR